MSTSREIADYQTHNVCLWLDNVESDYLAYIARIEKYGLFTATTAKAFVYNLWGDRTPDNVGMSRVRWGEVAASMNSDIKPGLKINTIKLMSKAAGHHFFDRDSMEHFNSKVYPNTRALIDAEGVAVGTLFVTSEQYNEYSPRLFTVRLFSHETKQISDIGGFQSWRTLDRALSVMRTYEIGREVAPAEVGRDEPRCIENPPTPGLSISFLSEDFDASKAPGLTLGGLMAICGLTTPELDTTGSGVDLESDLDNLLDQLGFGK